MKKFEVVFEPKAGECDFKDEYVKADGLAVGEQFVVYNESEFFYYLDGCLYPHDKTWFTRIGYDLDRLREDRAIVSLLAQRYTGNIALAAHNLLDLLQNAIKDGEDGSM